MPEDFLDRLNPVPQVRREQTDEEKTKLSQYLMQISANKFSLGLRG
jgi:hypothetical protein